MSGIGEIYLKNFEYHEPKTLLEASSLLKELGDKAMVFAGGTDIIPKMRLKRFSPAHLVNIKGIKNLRGIEFGESLSIGALTTFNDILFSQVINEKYPVLTEVCGHIASHQVRNLATVGGNLCNAAPSADSAPILMVLDSEVEIFSVNGTRTILLENLFKGPGAVALGKGDILIRIIVPEPKENTGHAYIKHTVRRSLDIAIVGVAVRLTMDEGGICNEARIVVGASAPIPLRAVKAERILAGIRLEPEVIEDACRAASSEISPIDDVRGSAEYRREMTEVNLKRAVETARRRVLDG